MKNLYPNLQTVLKIFLQSVNREINVEEGKGQNGRGL